MIYKWNGSNNFYRWLDLLLINILDFDKRASIKFGCLRCSIAPHLDYTVIIYSFFVLLKNYKQISALKIWKNDNLFYCLNIGVGNKCIATTHGREEVQTLKDISPFTDVKFNFHFLRIFIDDSNFYLNNIDRIIIDCSSKVVRHYFPSTFSSVFRSGCNKDLFHLFVLLVFDYFPYSLYFYEKNKKREVLLYYFLYIMINYLTSKLFYFLHILHFVLSSIKFCINALIIFLKYKVSTFFQIRIKKEEDNLLVFFKPEKIREFYMHNFNQAVQKGKDIRDRINLSINKKKFLRNANMSSSCDESKMEKYNRRMSTNDPWIYGVHVNEDAKNYKNHKERTCNYVDSEKLDEEPYNWTNQLSPANIFSKKNDTLFRYTKWRVLKDYCKYKSNKNKKKIIYKRR
ncbi:conserved Plasmodium protein, unknown function, partial [Plasmodium malariae]